MAMTADQYFYDMIYRLKDQRKIEEGVDFIGAAIQLSISKEKDLSSIDFGTGWVEGKVNNGGFHVYYIHI